MAGGLHQQIADFQQWREQLSQTISEYRQWLETTNSSDSLQDLRLFDMMETLRKDHLVLAFVAEFSRGKTETINALFFADYNQRLLPSEAGRTTMCPTEIFWDEREEPCIKLLPIETRKREHSRKPDEQYELIESCSKGPYLELFARGTRPGWTYWGNQADEDYKPTWKTYAYNSAVEAAE